MESLERDGYVFLKSVYNKEILYKIDEDFYNFYLKNNIEKELCKREDVRKDNYYVNNTYNTLNSFHKQQYYYLPVIDNRISHNRITDNGMIDIFNVNKLLKSINENINQDIKINIINKLTKKKWKINLIKLKINNNDINTNNYHYDDNESIKFTIYLNEVLQENGGGISFIEKTHLDKKFSNKQIKNFYGNAGDVLISFQKGYHRKLPQKNSINYFLVFNLIPKI